MITSLMLAVRPPAPEYAFGLTYFEFLRLSLTIASCVAVIGVLLFGRMYFGAFREGSRSGLVLSGMWNSAFFVFESGSYTLVSWFEPNDPRYTRIALLALPLGIVVQVIVNGLFVLKANKWRLR